jgi:HEAT repeat protein
MALVGRRTSDLDQQPREELPDQLNALNAADPVRRHRAALDLHEEERAVPALLSRVGVESDPAVREAVLTALAGYDTVEVAEALAPHLRSDDAGLRIAVADALAAMRQGVLPLLAALAVDSDHDVRIMTVLILSDLRAPEAVSWLVRIVSDDTHPNVVAAAVDALLPLAGAEHAPLLTRARDRFPDDPFLRFIVDGALLRLTAVQR